MTAPLFTLTSSCKFVHLIRKLGEGEAAEVEVKREGDNKLKDVKGKRCLKTTYLTAKRMSSVTHYTPFTKSSYLPQSELKLLLF